MVGVFYVLAGDDGFTTRAWRGIVYFEWGRVGVAMGREGECCI